jgi:hypothetical protein
MKVLFFLALQFATTFAYNEQDNTTYIYNKIIRERKLLPQNLFTEMSCQEYTTIQNCTCEAYCFKQVPNTLTCRANECTQWNKALKVCVNKNSDWTTAIILQSIPAISQLGVGYGYIERWDFFAGIWSPLGFICLIGCVASCLCGEDTNDTVSGFMMCIGVLWGISQLVLYIYGIWWIASENAIDGNGCQMLKSGTIIPV